MPANRPQTIVFITGAFVSSSCWDEWKGYFEGLGYTCLVPAWPHKEAPAETLRRRPNAGLAATRLAALTDYFADFVRQLPEKPILIGHSIGGLLVQLLLQRGVAAAGVAIHPVAPQGVIVVSWSMLRAVWGPLGFFTPLDVPFMMSFGQWQYAFTNGMPLEAQRAGYEKFAIPESKRISRDGLTSAAKVDFQRAHAPLLITSGSTDHIVPAKLNYANFRKYQHRGSVTAYQEFAGRNHFVLGQPTWREDAKFIADWLTANASAPVVSAAAQSAA